MILAAFLLGMALCALALSLIAANDEARTTDKFGAAVAQFSAWCAFGMLLMAGTYGLGLVIPAVTAAFVLFLRSTRFGRRISALDPFKMPLGIGALVASVVTWIGVLNLMEDIPNA